MSIITIRCFWGHKFYVNILTTYEKYQDLIARDDISAVVIAVADHSHAMVDIAACKAGKDVYLEKPMTFTIFEGQQLIKIVRDPVVPVKIGHISCTVCNLGNVACNLKRTIYWNPETQTFINETDGAATKLMRYKYRNPWKLI